MKEDGLNELALFAGAGGGILGGKLLGWRTVCAVEIDAFCARRLMQRQNEDHLPPFPIWDDVCTFDGYSWRGIIDVVSGGFPCQDISAAGKGAGITGERSGLWKQMARIICEVRPRFALVENSPVLTSRGLGTVLGDLAEMGYDARWGVLGACDVGAPHRRERIWIVASADLRRLALAGVDHATAKIGGGRSAEQRGGGSDGGRDDHSRADVPLANAQLQQRPDAVRERRDAGSPRHTARKRNESAGKAAGRGGVLANHSAIGGNDVGNSDHDGQAAAEIKGRVGEGSQWAEKGADKAGKSEGSGFESRVMVGPDGGRSAVVSNAHGGGGKGIVAEQPHSEGRSVAGQRPARPPGHGGAWWQSEPDVGRVAHGVASRVDRLTALGNGQVPAVVMRAWELLGPGGNL